MIFFWMAIFNVVFKRHLELFLGLAVVVFVSLFISNNSISLTKYSHVGIFIHLLPVFVDLFTVSMSFLKGEVFA